MPTVVREGRMTRKGGLQIHRPMSRRFTSADTKLKIEDEAALRDAFESADASNSSTESLPTMDNSDGTNTKQIRESLVKNALRRNFTQ